ncbi:hypothetical protein [Effusibacillus lacus]|uniref:Restriction system protein Mrr-like N-terminal domain-containing protein n=1 Tax=Effusibacillus lacus TaxID=1348429 RepID=A0A292YGG7_9BACL|nr:hypothetical protein [Effusibacillus lacus]TCS68547.1 hypothetical protein EDD64_14230 [Effusibacillus lacus]GAX88428.1 hypothetical protein EFBL_0037 [Effusibacillus lacus]
MLHKEDLPRLVEECLRINGGSASIVEVCKYVWDNYENELRNSGDLFFTWQYDIRWAATQLRISGVMKEADYSPKGVWELADNIRHK